MHLGTHIWMRDEPLEMTLERCARYGFESVMLIGDVEAYPVAETEVLLGEHGVRCWGAVVAASSGISFLNPDPATQRAAIAYATTWLSHIVALGGEVLVVVPHIGREQSANPVLEWGAAVESLASLNKRASEVGVCLAIEALNHYESRFLYRVHQSLALAEAVGPDCRVALDVYHTWLEEPDIVMAIEQIGDRIGSVDVADVGRRAAGDGSLDWEAIVKALQAVGYDGALLAEHDPPIDRSPARAREALYEPMPGMPAVLRHSADGMDRLASSASATLLPLMRGGVRGSARSQRAL